MRRRTVVSPEVVGGEGEGEGNGSAVLIGDEGGRRKAVLPSRLLRFIVE